MNHRLLAVVMGSIFASACSSKAPRTNPYDPEGSGPKAPGRIAGTVWIQGAVSQAGAPVHILDAAEVAADGGLVTTDDGKFLSPELVPATYRVEVDVPVGNVPIRVDGVVVLPGETTDVGFLPSLAEPPSGRIEGQVTLEDSILPPDGVRVTLMRTTGAVTVTDEKPTSADGTYVFEGLISGPYELRANRSGFTPDRATVNVDTSVPGAAQAPAMKLYPASSVVTFVVHTASGDVEGAPYTQSRDVDLKMLPFGGVNKMRLSEASDMMSGGVEEPWRDWLQQVPKTLSDAEGTKIMFAQFAVVDAGPPEVERMRTEMYTASVMLDQTAPAVLSFDLAPDAVIFGDIRYLNQDADPSSVPLTLMAQDPVSRIAGIKILVEGASPSTVTYRDVSTPDATINYFDTVSLTPTDGEKTVAIQLIDAAGNESLPVEKKVVIDTKPPKLNDPAVTVFGAQGGEIHSPFVTLQFAVTDDLANGIDGPTEMRFGLGTQPVAGQPFQAFAALASTYFNLTQNQNVQFYGVFRDNACNEVTAVSQSYHVNFKGAVSGRVLIEGVPETGPNAYHDGTSVEIFAAGADLSQPSTVPVASGVTVASGNYLVNDIPAGSYQVRFRRPGGIPIVRSPITVSAGATTELGTERIILARGTLTGVFQKADLGPSGNHGGITVTAFLAGKAIASASTDEAGLATISGLPISDAYEVKVSAENYVGVSLPSVKVVQDVIRPFNASPAGCEAVPLSCDPVALQRLLGDFKICDRDDTANPPKDCTAVLYTNKTQVLLGLDAQNVTHVRYIKQNPSAPGQNSFTNPAAQPTGGAICATPPQEDCWNPYVPTTKYVATVGSLSGPDEAAVTVVVQFANAGPPIDVRPVGTSDVIYDRAPPLSPAITIARGTEALIDGFTNNPEVTVTATAVATTGAEDQASPLGVVRVSRDATWDGAGNNGDREFSFAGTKLFTVDSGSDGVKSIYAWVCDKAANCTTTPVLATITLDRAPPTRTNGRDIAPAGVGISVKSLPSRQWWSRSPVYSVAIDVGASPYAGVPEVLAYRLGLTESFVGSTWTTLDLAVTAPNDIVSAPGLALPPVDGDHVVYAQFKDAAGNVSTAEVNADKFTLALDTVPPGGTVTLAGGADYTRTNPMSVALTTDAIDGATEYQYTWSGVLPDPYTGPRFVYSNTPAIPAASGGDGVKTLVVRFFDPAGNFAERSDTTFLDTTPPGSNAIASCDTCRYDSSGDIFFNAPSGGITLFLFATDNSGIISRVEVVVDGSAASKRVLQYAPYVAVTISTVEGPHSLQVTFFDPAENFYALSPFTVSLDKSPPLVSVVLDANAAWTRDPYVDVAITATDANELTGLYVSNSPTFGDAALRPFTTLVNGWLLAAPGIDGQKTVYVRVLDAAGNPADNEDTISLDATVPTLTVSIEGAVASGPSMTLTNTENVKIHLTASDPGGPAASGLSQMQVSNNADFSGASWVAFAATVDPFTLAAPATDGEKTVYARIRDVVGNVTQASSRIVLDKQAPTAPILTLAPSPYTTVTASQATLGATGATEMCLWGSMVGGSSDSCAANGWQALAATLPVTLTAGDGLKTVNARYRDAAGWVSPTATAAVTLDGTPPATGSVVINGGAASTSSVGVTLGLAATDATSGVADMALANEAIDCAAAAYEPYVTLKSWTLSSSDGLRTVLVCFRDRAGKTLQASSTITLDRQAPTGLSLTIAGGATYTTSTSVSLTLAATGAAQMCIAGDLATPPDCLTSGWESVATPKTVTLAGPDGAKVVTVTFRDAAGNVASVSDGIILDTQNPTGTVLINNDDPYTTSAGVTLRLTAAADVTQMRINNDAACSGGVLEPFATTKVWSLTGGEGLRTVNVCYYDAAGLPGTASDTITQDTVKPTGTVSINAGASFTITRDVTLSMSTTADAVGMAIADGASLDCASTAYGPVQASRAWLLPFGDGTPSVTVCYLDRAGNTASATDGILLDTTPPATPGLTATSLTDRYVTLQWTTPSDIDLAGFSLERRLDNQGTFTVIASSLAAIATSYVDRFPSTELGRGRIYRIRAYDTHGLYSGYSIELDAGVPIGRSSVVYMNPYGPPSYRALGWTRPTGTALLLGTYRYYDAAGRVFEQALGTNAVFAQLDNGGGRYNEQLTLLGQNTDATLAWESEFKFGNLRQQIETTGYNWAESRIALGPDGTPHLFWGNEMPGSVFRYQKLDGVSAPITIDSTNDDRFCDIAVDSNGIPRLVWVRSAGIYYQKLDGVSTPQLIAAGSYVGTRIALDSTNTPHICSGKGGMPFRLVYVKINGVNTLEYLDTVNDVGRECSIAIDKNNIPHISYYDYTTLDLKYIKKDGVSTPQVLDSAGNVGYSTSIDIDPINEVPVIGYYDATNNRAKVVRLGNAPVVACYNGGDNLAIAVDDWGTTHVTFSSLDGGKPTLGYVTIDRVGNVDNAMAPRAVDQRGSPGGQCDIAVDDLGRAHILHRNGSGNTVEYARLEPTPPLVKIAGPNTDSPDIAVDNANVATLVYVDGTQLKTVRMAHRMTTTVMATSASSIGFPSIDMDSAGNSHIAYYDSAPADLKYVHTGFGSVTLDSTGNVGYYPSLAVTPSGAVHVTYTDQTGSTVKWTRADIAPTPTVIDTADISTLSSLVVDASGIPKVVYTKPAGSVRQWWYRPMDGVTAPLQVATGSWAPVLALSPTGLPYIAGGNVIGNALQFVYNPPANSLSVLDQSVQGTGSYVDMKVDAEGLPNIVYLAPDFGNLFGYLRVDGMSRPQRFLTSAAVEPLIGSLGGMDAMAMDLDSRGVAHIVFLYRDGDDAPYILYTRGRFNQPLVQSRVNTVLIPSACKASEVFGMDMIGCAGKFLWSQRATICSEAGLTSCTAQKWVDRNRGLVPQYNYWTDDDLHYNGNAAACWASTAGGNACSSPMRVCSANPDSMGNACNWVNCGYQTLTPNQYFGGCAGNTTAGVLCCTP